MYFDNFPLVAYNDHTVTDITRRFNITDVVKDGTAFYFLHEITEGETPETIAYDYYGDAGYHWVVLIMNNIIDPFYDWILQEDELLVYTKNKYGSDPSEYQGVHHWEDDTGKITTFLNPQPAEDDVDIVAAGLYPVSNLEFETRLNEEKRSVKILSPYYLNDITIELAYVLEQQ